MITDREDFSDIEEICDFIIDIDAAESDKEKQSLIWQNLSIKLIQFMSYFRKENKMEKNEYGIFQVKPTYSESSYESFNTEIEALRYAGQLEIDMCREIYPELADSQYSRNADELTKEELEELLYTSGYEVIDLTGR